MPSPLSPRDSAAARRAMVNSGFHVPTGLHTGGESRRHPRPRHRPSIAALAPPPHGNTAEPAVRARNLPPWPRDDRQGFEKSPGGIVDDVDTRASKGLRTSADWVSGDDVMRSSGSDHGVILTASGRAPRRAGPAGRSGGRSRGASSCGKGARFGSPLGPDSRNARRPRGETHAPLCGSCERRAARTAPLGPAARSWFAAVAPLSCVPPGGPAS